jgi:SRSO17 transposase
VLMDAGYGNDTRLRTDIAALGLRYVAGIGPSTSVWPPGEAPMPPQSRAGRGRPQTRLQRGQHQPISVKTLSLSLPREAWQTITWREGTTDWLSSRFVRRRVRPGAFSPRA